MRTLRARFLAAFLISLGVPGCGWMADLFEPDEIKPKTVTLRGTVAVPDGPTDYLVLTTNRWLAYQWTSCPEVSNDSAHNKANGTFLLESTNNCAGAQMVYFYAENPVDMSKFATGTLSFTVQANNAGQNLSVLVQDNNSVASNTLNLANYGFVSSTVGVDQAISLPVTALTNGTAISLQQMKRLFQLQVGCATSDCYTYVGNVRWVPPAVQMSPYAAQSLRKAPRCDPFACRPVKYGRVGVVRVSPTGWTAEPDVRVTTTDAEGNYTLIAPTAALDGQGPVFVAVTDIEAGITLLSTIADGYIRDGGEGDVDVDRTTTAVSMLVCPNGMTIPADGSGGYCIGDPIGVADLDTLGTAVDGALDKTASADIDVFWEDVVEDEQVLTALNTFLAEHGEAAVTYDVFVNIDVTIEIPVITSQPTSTGTTGGTDVVGATCQGAVACEVCTIEACATGGADSSCSAWYQTSDGKRFSCASCGDCQAAANQATQYCCPTPQ